MGRKLKKSDNEAMAEYENDIDLDNIDKKREKRKKKDEEGEEKRVILPSMIKNKEKRSVVHAKLQHMKKVEKRKKLKARDATEKRAIELGEEVLLFFPFISLIFLCFSLFNYILIEISGLYRCLNAMFESQIIFVEQFISYLLNATYICIVF